MEKSKIELGVEIETCHLLKIIQDKVQDKVNEMSEIYPEIERLINMADDYITGETGGLISINSKLVKCILHYNDTGEISPYLMKRALKRLDECVEVAIQIAKEEPRLKNKRKEEKERKRLKDLEK